VFLYYFEDARGAVYATLSYLIVTILVSALMMWTHQPSFYGFGAFAGAFTGWTVAFFRLRHILNHLDYQMFCRGHILGMTNNQDIKITTNTGPQPSDPEPTST
jgi:uncharacterized membrane protein